MEMEKTKSNKTLIILLIIFGIVILGLGGYIIYDKFIADTGAEEKNNNNTNNNADKISANDLIGTYNYIFNCDEGTPAYSEGKNSVTSTFTFKENNEFYWGDSSCWDFTNHYGMFSIENDIITVNTAQFKDMDFDETYIIRIIDKNNLEFKYANGIPNNGQYPAGTATYKK